MPFINPQQEGNPLEQQIGAEKSLAREQAKKDAEYQAYLDEQEQRRKLEDNYRKQQLQMQQSGQQQREHEQEAREVRERRGMEQEIARLLYQLELQMKQNERYFLEAQLSRPLGYDQTALAASAGRLVGGYR